MGCVYSVKSSTCSGRCPCVGPVRGDAQDVMPRTCVRTFTHRSGFPSLNPLGRGVFLILHFADFQSQYGARQSSTLLLPERTMKSHTKLDEEAVRVWLHLLVREEEQLCCQKVWGSRVWGKGLQVGVRTAVRSRVPGLPTHVPGDGASSAAQGKPRAERPARRGRVATSARPSPSRPRSSSVASEQWPQARSPLTRWLLSFFPDLLGLCFVVWGGAHARAAFVCVWWGVLVRVWSLGWGGVSLLCV